MLPPPSEKTKVSVPWSELEFVFLLLQVCPCLADGGALFHTFSYLSSRCFGASVLVGCFASLRYVRQIVDGPNCRHRSGQRMSVKTVFDFQHGVAYKPQLGR